MLKMLQSPFQIGVHIVKAMIFSQVNQHSRSTATVSGPTEAAVTDPSARRAQPLLPGMMRIKNQLELPNTYTHDQM